LSEEKETKKGLDFIKEAWK